jgi:hypothetical protein
MLLGGEEAEGEVSEKFTTDPIVEKAVRDELNKSSGKPTTADLGMG